MNINIKLEFFLRSYGLLDTSVTSQFPDIESFSGSQTMFMDTVTRNDSSIAVFV